MQMINLADKNLVGILKHIAFTHFKVSTYYQAFAKQMKNANLVTNFHLLFQAVVLLLIYI